MAVVDMPLDVLLISDVHGLNLEHLSELVLGTRVDNRPLQVRPSWCGAHFVVVRGRHRFLHAAITGASSVPCRVEQSP